MMDLGDDRPKKPSNDGNLGTRNDGQLDKRTISLRHILPGLVSSAVALSILSMPYGTAAQRLRHTKPHVEDVQPRKSRKYKHNRRG
jgi:hypothetical protein